MTQFLLDTDAFLAMRSLSILTLLCESEHHTRVPFLMTEFIARRELNQLQKELVELESTGLLLIERIERKSEGAKLWKELKKGRVHKGEAEAMAWLLT